jgi:hypothetical protein
MKRNINDSAYLGDLLVTDTLFSPETGCLKYDWEGIHSQKRHDGNAWFLKVTMLRKRYKLNQGYGVKHLL